jgi:hypothetical protein
MTINEICNVLKDELFNNDYKYGFIVNGEKHTPNMTGGFDNEYYNLSMTIYRIQNPIVTMKEKIGTCIDACLVMKHLLSEHNILSKIWLLYNKMNNKVHTILTFEAESKVVYLELTPQSAKPYYGKEILFDSIEDFLTKYYNDGIDIEDVTEELIVGLQPLVLINKINN